MWLNYAVRRIPLALRPHTLKFLRHIATMPKVATLSEDLKAELREWLGEIDTVYTVPQQREVPISAWSGATETKIAVTLGNEVYIASTSKPVPIAAMELTTAGWAIFLDHNANLHVDNQVAAYALAK